MKKIVSLAVGLLCIGAGCQTSAPIKPVVIEDMGQQIQVQALVDAKDDLENNEQVSSGGLLVLYGDVTGDGADEALVEIPSGGTAGSIAVLVYSLNAQKNISLLKRIDGYRLSSRPNNGKLEVLTSSPSDESTAATLTTYSWTGSDFKEESSVDKKMTNDCYSDVWQAHQCTI